MERHRTARRTTIATALGAAVAISIVLPTAAPGDPVSDVLGGLGVGGGGSNGGGNAGGGAPVAENAPAAPAQNRAGTPPNYQPPLHGTNPHGEGAVATVDLLPSNNNPYPGNPSSGDEEVVVGDSRGEHNGSNYHGRVTLAYVSLPPPFPPGVINVFIETNPGETKQGPTGPLNSGPLADLCTASGGNICIQVLPMDSSTTSTSSTNSFAIFRGSFGNGATRVNLGESGGSINETGGCQAATGSSSIANGNVTGLGAFDVFSSSSASTACYTGYQSTQNSSTFINLFGLTPPGGLPIIGPFFTACNNLVPNSSFVGPGGLLSLVCHADEVNGGQTASPYGVREAFTAFLLPFGNTAVVKLALSGPESHVVAPPAPPAGQAAPGSPQGGTRGKAKKGGGEEAGAVAGELAEGGGGALPLTGENVLLLGLIGTGLVGLGLLGAAASRRRTA